MTDSRVSYRKIALPSEHGGWGIVMEPVVLGLIVAWSQSGLLIGLAALATFLAREPFKIAAGDLIIRRRSFPRTRPALAFAAGWSALAVALLFLVYSSHGLRPLVPIAIAGPFAFLQSAIDLRGQGRSVTAELAGTFAMSASAPAIILSDDRSIVLGLVLWTLATFRSMSAILYVRARLRKERKEPFSLGPSSIVHILTLVITMVFFAAGHAPALAVLAFLALLGRSLSGLTSPEPITAQQVGFGELGWGLSAILLIGIGFRAGL